MKLPNFSYMMNVAQLRYIQSVYESPEHRNPDFMIRRFLPTLQRWGCDLRGKLLLSRLRSQPFYYYVLARTRYYDKVFADAIGQGLKYIVNVGCGSDTRAHRFAAAIRAKDVVVLECDQPQAIRSKHQIAKRRWPADQVKYLPIDLNDRSWPEFEIWMSGHCNSAMLVLMEGVSPYVAEDTFGRFLGYLVSRLRAGSRVVYDFKLCGLNDGFGRSDRVVRPFRLSAAREYVLAYHASLGYEIEQFQLSSEMEQQVLLRPADSDIPLFQEDGLVQLVVPEAQRS